MTESTSVRELVVVSGKGGTGKTSIAASFAVLARDVVVADCDVDAADLHLMFQPQVRKRTAFWSGHEAVIQRQRCTMCGLCSESCRFQAIVRGPEGFTVDPFACEGCGLCVRRCPEGAISFPERLCGEWMVSRTRIGTMVHARLAPAAENSGRLVAVVRREARACAEEEGIPLVIIDGPPGIGCPVISAMTGTHVVVAVTEPTCAGEHDVLRVLELARHFRIPAFLCVNKWDLNAAVTERIEERASALGATLVGRVSYDSVVTTAQMWGRSVVEMDGLPYVKVRGEIVKVWEEIQRGISHTVAERTTQGG